MIFRIILLLISLGLAGIVAYASVFGFMVIFAGAPHFAMAMGASIESAKLVGISFLYRHWGDDNVSNKFKYSLLSVTLMTILLSAIGVFGFLSKAHLETNTPMANNSAKLEYISEQIDSKQNIINSSKSEIKSLNDEVNKLIEFDKVSGPTGSKATREQQQPRRDILNQAIKEANQAIFDLRDQRLELTQEVNAFDAKIGPIRYVAELFWDIDDKTNEDKAIRLLILLVMFVFDPFAILLLIGYNHVLFNKRDTKASVEEVEEDLFIEIDADIENNVETEDIEVEDIIQKIDDAKTSTQKEEKNDDSLNELTEMVRTLSENVKKQTEESDKRKNIQNKIRQGQNNT